jgi:hypothetical protein
MPGQKRVEDARERAYTRASIEKMPFNQMTLDCRVKPGNDGG